MIKEIWCFEIFLFKITKFFKTSPINTVIDSTPLKTALDIKWKKLLKLNMKTTNKPK